MPFAVVDVCFVDGPPGPPEPPDVPAIEVGVLEEVDVVESLVWDFDFDPHPTAITTANAVTTRANMNVRRMSRCYHDRRRGCRPGCRGLRS